MRDGCDRGVTRRTCVTGDPAAVRRFGCRMNAAAQSRGSTSVSRFFTGWVPPPVSEAHSPGMYSREPSRVPPDGDPATLRRLRAALELAPAGAVFSGKTAAWLHGLEIEPCDPIEMIVPIEPMNGSDLDESSWYGLVLPETY